MATNIFDWDEEQNYPQSRDSVFTLSDACFRNNLSSETLFKFKIRQNFEYI